MIDLQRAHGARGRGRRAREERRRRAVAALEEVGIPDASTRIDAHPHTFSGGMRQRVMIATALLLGPALLVADEPTSALDATLVAQVLALLRRTRDERGTAILLISHDLRAVAAISDRVLVMSEGRIVEHGDAVSVLTAPQHPYTRTLLGAMPFRADGVPRSRRNAIEPMR
jgi:peptide/nickel transport system ATP-binding protein